MAPWVGTMGGTMGGGEDLSIKELAELVRDNILSGIRRHEAKGNWHENAGCKQEIRGIEATAIPHCI